MSCYCSTCHCSHSSEVSIFLASTTKGKVLGGLQNGVDTDPYTYVSIVQII